MFKLKSCLIVVFSLILFTSAACSPGAPSEESAAENDSNAAAEAPNLENPRAYAGPGFSFHYPGDWVLLDEETVAGSVSLRLQEEGNPAAQVIISYFPGTGLTKEDAITEAETLLRAGLFRIQGALSSREEKIGEKIIPIVYARSGEKEIKLVETAVFTGERGFLLATLLVREEAEAHFSAIFPLILAGIEVK